MEDALRECRYCGLFQTIGDLPDGAVARCGRCDALLRRARADSLDVSLACAIGAALLFTFALALPFLSFRVSGRSVNAALLTGPEVLAQSGVWALAVAIDLTLVALPATKLFVTIAALLGARHDHPPRWLPWAFGWLQRLTPWAMVEVFLLGTIVAYTRLRALGQVEVGPSALAIFGVTLAMVATDATLDEELVWRRFAERIPGRGRVNEPGAPLVSCDTCGRVDRARDGTRCGLCRHVLHARKPNGVARTRALTLAAALLYVPANVLPVMNVVRLGHGGPKTILSGVVELAEAHMWPLAAIVFVASIVVPVAKLVAITVMLAMTHWRSAARLRERTRAFRLVSTIGRWSMIDVFMLATLAATVRMGVLAKVLPEQGALAFCAVVVLTMFATDLFDPRVMWDAAKARAKVAA